MTVEEAITARVLASPIAPSLAAWNSTRAVHWGCRPEGAGLAAIIFTMIDVGTAYVHGGRDALSVPLIQADVLAESYGKARTLADMLGRLLEEPAESGAIRFSHGFIERDADIPVADVRGAQFIHGRSLRLSLYCKE